MKNHAITALLPMKGHSERVPGKNIRDFAGKPLFYWVLDALTASGLIGEIIIDTDSAEIAALARGREKVRIIERPQELRGDFVSMNSIIGHDLSLAASEHFLQTHSTNPLVRGETIDRAIERYFDGLAKNDSLFSVTPWQCRFYTADGRPVNHNPAELLRTQDLPPLYEENSCLYIFSQKSFAAAGDKRIGLTPALFPMSRLEAVDIDEEEDFILAETLAARRVSGGGRE